MREAVFVSLVIIFSSGYSSPLSRDPIRIPGTVLISNTVSMRQTEVTVDDWIEFVVANNFNPSLYPEDNAITDCWTRALFNDLRRQSNFQHFDDQRRALVKKGNGRSLFLKRDALFDSLRKIEIPPINSPITGITYEQALKFCKWTEDNINKSRSEDKMVKIELPSMEIYKKIITNVDSVSKASHNSCRIFTFNYKHPPCSDKDIYVSLQGQSLIRADSYWPTSLGLYGIQGNAAEMTSTKGVAMGGSFRHYAKQSTNDEIQSYSGPEDWLGFRYIATLYSSIK